ncbi:gamma-glutamyl hydrolase [Rana temporaria]|uniref:gamma-glutamyl hydrolase n=1 Tax=Rana temporaria TaxID=8407 RepID=UPI001AAC4DC5|nr:gamma-glutamyl hydrolase [Rana temporaria]
MQCGIFSCEFGRWRRRGWEGCVPSRYPQDSDLYSLCVLPAGRLCWPLPPVRKEKILRHSVTMGSAGLMMILVVVFLFSRSWSSSVISADPPINDSPVIGVVAQEIHFENLMSHGRSYIAASYIKTLESAGARVLPIRINLPKEEYVKIFNAINGVLLPGGGVDLQTSEYARVSKIFYDLAIEANDRGDYFPFWGTCLGFEQMTVLTSGQLLLTTTHTNGVLLPLNFTESALRSRLFQNISPSLYQSLAKKPLSSHYHSWSLSMKNYTATATLRKFYNVLSTNFYGDLEYVSTMEAYDYPFYGVIWHPEKNPFEWKTSSAISHTAEAVQVAFYMAEFFVNEARKSRHQYSKDAETAYPLIYNYCPAYTGNISVFEQMYFF